MSSKSRIKNRRRAKKKAIVVFNEFEKMINKKDDVISITRAEVGNIFCLRERKKKEISEEMHISISVLFVVC